LRFFQAHLGLPSKLAQSSVRLPRKGRHNLVGKACQLLLADGLRRSHGK
jgi:hypothetical protein